MVVLFAVVSGLEMHWYSQIKFLVTCPYLKFYFWNSARFMTNWNRIYNVLNHSFGINAHPSYSVWTPYQYTCCQLTGLSRVADSTENLIMALLIQPGCCHVHIGFAHNLAALPSNLHTSQLDSTTTLKWNNVCAWTDAPFNATECMYMIIYIKELAFLSPLNACTHDYI